MSTLRVGKRRTSSLTKVWQTRTWSRPQRWSLRFELARPKVPAVRSSITLFELKPTTHAATRPFDQQKEQREEAEDWESDTCEHHRPHRYRPFKNGGSTASWAQPLSDDPASRRRWRVFVIEHRLLLAVGFFTARRHRGNVSGWRVGFRIDKRGSTVATEVRTLAILRPTTGTLHRPFLANETV